MLSESFCLRGNKYIAVRFNDGRPLVDVFREGDWLGNVKIDVNMIQAVQNWYACDGYADMELQDYLERLGF